MRDAQARLARTPRPYWAATLFVRLALSSGFLSAVADRFGAWGLAGSSHVAWGNFHSFVHYVGELAPYLPEGLVGVVAWSATALEIALGALLLVGFMVRPVAWASTGTLLAFAVSMFLYSGFETPLSASVFSACAAALLLALRPPGTDIISLDHLRRHRCALQKETT